MSMRFKHLINSSTTCLKTLRWTSSSSSPLDPVFPPCSKPVQNHVIWGFWVSSCHHSNNAFLYKSRQRGGSVTEIWLWRVFAVRFLVTVNSTAEPSHPLRQETGAGCPASIWSSRCVSAGLFSGWGGTLSSPGSPQRGSRSAGVLRWEPSASPHRCSTSSPACGAYTYKQNQKEGQKYVSLYSLRELI